MYLPPEGKGGILMNKKDKIIMIIVLLMIVGTLVELYVTFINNRSTYELVKIVINGVVGLLQLLLSCYF